MKQEGEPRFANPVRLREEARDAGPGVVGSDRPGRNVRLADAAQCPGVHADGDRRSGHWRRHEHRRVSDPERPGVESPARQRSRLPGRRFNRRGPQGTSSQFAYPALDFYATHNTVLASSMGLMRALVALESDTSRAVPVQFVTANYLLELGAVPALGRLLDAARDDEPDAEPVVVLGRPCGKAGSAPIPPSPGERSRSTAGPSPWRASRRHRSSG